MDAKIQDILKELRKLFEGLYGGALPIWYCPDRVRAVMPSRIRILTCWLVKKSSGQGEL